MHDDQEANYNSGRELKGGTCEIWNKMPIRDEPPTPSVSDAKTGALREKQYSSTLSSTGEGRKSASNSTL